MERSQERPGSGAIGLGCFGWQSACSPPGILNQVTRLKSWPLIAPVNSALYLINASTGISQINLLPLNKGPSE